MNSEKKRHGPRPNGVKKPRPKVHRGKAPKIIPAFNQKDKAFIQSMIAYEDLQTLVLNKPSGVAAQGGAGVVGDLDYLLGAFAKSNGKKPKLVHRLDRETSGLILAGKTTPATAFYSKEFAERRAQKTYFAFVAGKIEANEGEINFPIKRGKINGIDIALRAEEDDKDGDEAITLWQKYGGNDKVTVLKLMPKTGRMHQLRCHLSNIGHPILGDTKYGGLLAIGGVAVPRLMLHAKTLKIAHPGGGIKSFAVPMPDDMLQFLDDLGLG